MFAVLRDRIPCCHCALQSRPWRSSRRTNARTFEKSRRCAKDSTREYTWIKFSYFDASGRSTNAWAMDHPAVWMWPLFCHHKRGRRNAIAQFGWSHSLNFRSWDICRILCDPHTHKQIIFTGISETKENAEEEKKKREKADFDTFCAAGNSFLKLRARLCSTQEITRLLFTPDSKGTSPLQVRHSRSSTYCSENGEIFRSRDSDHILVLKLAIDTHRERLPEYRLVRQMLTLIGPNFSEVLPKEMLEEANLTMKEANGLEPKASTATHKRTFIEHTSSSSSQAPSPSPQPAGFPAPTSFPQFSGVQFSLAPKRKKEEKRKTAEEITQPPPKEVKEMAEFDPDAPPPPILLHKFTGPSGWSGFQFNL